MPHDYIYGFFGLLSEQDRALTNVDYQGSHWDLYRSVTKRLLAKKGLQGMKPFSTLSFSGPSERPSWIPDFGNQSMAGPQSGVLLTMDECWQDQPAVRFSDDNEVLMLAGVLLGEVTWLRALTGTMRDSIKNFRELSSLAKATAPGSGLVSLRRMFTGNNFGRGPVLTYEIEPVELDRCWDVLMDDIYTLDTLLLSGDGEIPRPELDGLSTSIVCSILGATAMNASIGRSLFATNTGLIGISVPQVQLGDSLVYLFGMFAPFVLRLEWDRYQIVGVSRVAGLEDATLMERYCTEQQVTEATFRLG
ncbi:hypothetical protein LTS10_006404 [Elasticomyces elasticus]|nr:hypothetical protein LTS10_006404 [Elasticomyces elasticus]